ncbi:hypothetical protein DSLASN_07230 [Desulfoluna limicola]|uniref:Uncharacterized protein n=1 Tax=Desulfoluna limicola TaxID=2810562 RepID=A0ABM7PCY0_9BACT|nr:hypothetical protein DSLASN_07230 [Desulfoluna limicola]
MGSFNKEQRSFIKALYLVTIQRVPPAALPRGKSHPLPAFKVAHLAAGGETEPFYSLKALW